MEGSAERSLRIILIRREAQAKMILIDPRASLGLGLAYSTPSYRHLLNVPAGKISALPDQPNQFLDWLQKNYDASMTEADFAPRAVFGRYIQSLLRPSQEGTGVPGFAQEDAQI